MARSVLRDYYTAAMEAKAEEAEQEVKDSENTEEGEEESGEGEGDTTSTEAKAEDDKKSDDDKSGEEESEGSEEKEGEEESEGEDEPSSEAKAEDGESDDKEGDDAGEEEGEGEPSSEAKAEDGEKSGSEEEEGESEGDEAGESEEEEEAEGEEEDTGVESLDYVALSIEEAESEVDDVEDDIDELGEIKEGMEEIAASLEATLDHGGLDVNAAQMAHHAVDAYTARLGISSEQIVPGLESFGGDTGKIAATQVALESVQETLAKIWAAMKAAIEKAIKAIGDFFAKISGGVDKIEKRLETLKKEVEEAKSKSADSSAEISVPNPNSLMFEGKVDAGDVRKGFVNLATALDRVQDNFVKANIDGIDMTVKLIKGEDKVEQAAADFVKKYEEALSPVMGKTLPGDKEIAMEDYMLAASNGVKKPVIKSVKGASPFKGGKVKPLNYGDMVGLITSMQSILDSIKKKEDIVGKYQSEVKSGKEKVDQLLKSPDKAEDTAGDKVRAKLIQWGVNATMNTGMGFVAKMQSSGFASLRSGIGYIEASLKAYK